MDAPTTVLLVGVAHRRDCQDLAMKRRAADILKDALALPAKARAALASQLRDSLDPHSEVRRRQFARATRRALRLRNGLDLQWAPAASRDELHRR